MFVAFQGLGAWGLRLGNNSSGLRVPGLGSARVLRISYLGPRF